MLASHILCTTIIAFTEEYTQQSLKVRFQSWREHCYFILLQRFIFTYQNGSQVNTKTCGFVSVFREGKMVYIGTTLVPHNSILSSDITWSIVFCTMNLQTHQFLILPRAIKCLIVIFRPQNRLTVEEAIIIIYIAGYIYRKIK